MTEQDARIWAAAFAGWVAGRLPSSARDACEAREIEAYEQRLASQASDHADYVLSLARRSKGG